ncbi:hypothetical protein M8J75_010588 [Diaphorina citri]|nr:hypothetical protein M8J75_010588 [Diaphorina citri]
MTTRRETLCPIMGNPSSLKDNVLPTYADVMKHFLFVKNELLWKRNQKTPAASEICDLVSRTVEEIWQKASIPTVSHQQIVLLVKTFNQKYVDLKKLPISRKGTEEKRKAFFQDATKRLFDIAVCKCVDFSKCKCHSKIPTQERGFLIDQRTERKMMIGSVDKVTTKKQVQSLERKMESENRKKRLQDLTRESATDVSEIQSLDSEESSEDDQVEENNNVSTYHLKRLNPSPTQDTSTSTSEQADQDVLSIPSISKQMRLSLPNLALACDRTGVSDRSAAIIASSVLLDVGLVSQEDSSRLIDRSSTYIGHVTPESGTSEHISLSITSFITQNDIQLSKLIAVGCDGTNVNTGKNNGIIRRLELFVGHKLHWFVCLLHANELPLRHLFQKIDGKTTGPQHYAGIIGKALETCETLPLIEFDPIPTTLPLIDKKDLSSDQQYLLDITLAISTGDFPTTLSNRSPGKMAHSRWLTTANRILRLYASTENPSAELKLLAEYVTKVYAPAWFNIKTKPKATQGVRHLHDIIKRCSFLPEEYKSFVFNVIQRNAFFAHSENVLVAMLEDERPYVRELALRRIMKARSLTKKPEKSEVRIFVVPPLHFGAEEYYNLISWDEPMEPAVTMKLSDDDIKTLIRTGSELEALKLPCHTQASD